MNCRYCGHPIKQDASPGVLVHDPEDDTDGHDLDADHVPVPEDDE